MHPPIYQEIKHSLQKAKGLYTLAVIPLLLENRTSKLLKKKPSSTNYIKLDRILLVTAPRDLQIQRARERDLLEKDQINAILAAQISPVESINQADDIIHNESNLQNLYKSIQTLHEKYLSLIRSQQNSLDDSSYLGYYLVFK